MKKSLYLLLIFLLGVIALAIVQQKKNAFQPAQNGRTQSLNMSGIIENSPNNKSQTPITAWVIIPENCRSCQTGAIVDQFKLLFPGLGVNYLGSQESTALELIKLFQIKMLPAYILSREVEASANFAQLRPLTTFIKDKFYFDPSFTGVSYFWGRVLEPRKIDLFVSLTHPDTLPILQMIEGLMLMEPEIKFALHLVGDLDPQTKKIISPAGKVELAEDKLYACVDQYYPQKSREYLKCRLGDTDRFWLDECLSKSEIKKDQIKDCLKSESDQWLGPRVKLSQELKVVYAPLILLDNVEIFGANAKTTVDEILSIIDPAKVKQ